MPASTPRREFEAEAIRLFGPSWPDHLAHLANMNIRTAERMGGQRHPLDARRLAIIALRLLTGSADPSARELAVWCIDQAIERMEDDRRREASYKRPGSP